MEEDIQLTPAQELIYEVYAKGVQHEDCDLQEYVDKLHNIFVSG